MSISYYNDMQFIGGSELPDCRVQIDQDFGRTLSINYLWRGRIHFKCPYASATALEGPALYWTLPDAHYVYGNLAGAEWYQLWVMVKGPRIERMIEGGLIPGATLQWACPERPDFWFQQFRELIQFVRLGGHDDLPRMVNIVERFFIDAAAAFKGSGLELETAPSHVRAITQAVAESPQLQWDFRQQSAEACISYPHFRRLFRKINGTSPYQYLVDCRLRLAASRLRSGRCSVKVAAFEAGFKSPDALTLHMRTRMGLVPSDLLPRG
jgi:AraC-like DNA-binding protein